MKKILLLILFLSMPLNAFCQDGYSNSPKQKTESCELFIESDQRTYNKNEKISIACKLKNISNDNIALDDDYKLSNFTFHCDDKDGIESSTDSLDIAEKWLPEEFLPGEIIDLGELVAKLPESESAGNHSIYISNENLRSNTIIVEITR